MVIRSNMLFARAALAAAALFLAPHAWADKIKNPTAVFSGLDKITGRIISFEVAIDETVQFGSLQITPRVCYTRPATEAPQTDTFVEVDEVSADKQYKRIFSGWMYAASPGLNGIEHPVYDIWLTECKGGTSADVIAEAPPANADPAAAAAATPGIVPETTTPDNATKPNTPPPKPRRVVRSQPRPEEAPRREPVQSFYPTSEFPSNVPSYGRRGPGGF